MYESQSLIPLILFNPSRPVVTEITRPVRLLDVMPTILEYAGIASPKESVGWSLLPLLDGEHSTVELPPYFIVETRYREAEKVAVNGEGWKYIENRDEWPGVNPRELQPQGGRENGAATDRLRQVPDVAERMRSFLEGYGRRVIRPRDPARACGPCPRRRRNSFARSATSSSLLPPRGFALPGRLIESPGPSSSGDRPC